MFGGKVLGEGGFGCVVEPHYPCKNKKTDIELVSKIVSIKKSSDYQDIVDELNISLKLKKIDPKNTYFLGGIEKCNIKKKDIRKDDKDNCDKIKESNKFVNILIPKGENFDNIIKDMDKDSIYKTIRHLTKGVKLLVLKKLLFLDIKPDNFLFVKDKNNPDNIHPVFIDFGRDYVIKSKTGMAKFLRNFASIFYYPLAPEINITAYIKGAKFNILTFNSLLRNLNDGRRKIRSYYKIQPDSEEAKEIKKNFYNELEKNYSLTTERLMIYSVGLAIISTLQIYQPKLLTNIKLRSLLTMMTDMDIRQRATCDEVIKIVDDMFPKNIKENISINDNSKLKKKQKKLFKSLTPLQRQIQKPKKKGVLKKIFSFIKKN